MRDQKNPNPIEPPQRGELEVGIAGLGRMGRVFANLVIAGGVRVTAYDIDAEKVKAAAKDGAIPASAIHDLGRCEVVLTALPDDDAVRSVVLSEGGPRFRLAAQHDSSVSRHHRRRLLPGA
jgi:3-hydroxyisobutyrate dehydrogenase-like beta-hydroxyacid dehydrogenase